MSEAARQGATLEDFLAIPEGERFHELLVDELVERAAPSGEHGGAQAGVIGAILPSYQRQAGRGGPGGWWIASEVECRLKSGSVVRPDVSGWRRERCPERPTGGPIARRPDWVCEVVSPSNANVDTVTKLRLYHEAEIPHYWIVDPRDATLTVMRWSDEGFVTLLRAERGEVVRPAPFDEIEIAVGALFGDDPEP
ncbi:MAG TPA: Uma2 family endonuclease [Sandaracinaceae bacterium LLY-WYZ-13_1]|nr:Uma2 family endonuclease [Sandaracinaceae bacterium LLY-WYZ-13_1]